MSCQYCKESLNDCECVSVPVQNPKEITISWADSYYNDKQTSPVKKQEISPVKKPYNNQVKVNNIVTYKVNNKTFKLKIKKSSLNDVFGVIKQVGGQIIETKEIQSKVEPTEVKIEIETSACVSCGGNDCPQTYCKVNKVHKCFNCG